MKINLMDTNPSTRKRLTDLVRQRKSIFQTRCGLAAAIFAFTIVNPQVTYKWEIIASIVFYCLFHIGFAFLPNHCFRLKRVRFTRAVSDVILVSIVTLCTGGRDSLWFIFYTFPIMSVSRYFSTKGSLAVASIATIAYSWIFFHGFTDSHIGITAFTLRVSFFFTIAVAARDLSKVRKSDELEPVTFFKEIDSLLRKFPPAKAYRRILERGLQLTDSEMGHIFLASDRTAVAAIGPPSDLTWPFRTIDQQLIERTRQSKRSWRLNLKRKTLNLILDKPVILSRSAPKSALMVPIMIDQSVEGVFGVYSDRKYHYTEHEQERLESLTTAIAIVLNHTKLLKAFKERLQLVYGVSTQLSTSHSLEELFPRVVDAVLTHCKSEEAALFVAEPSANVESPAILRKIAVKGLGKDGSSANKSTRQGDPKELRTREAVYREGEGVVGRVFADRQPVRLMLQYGDVQDDDAYGDLLPSGSLDNAIAAPLLFGDERFGVIRALNRRDIAETLANTPDGAITKGFDENELTLLQIIGSQVAAAIHNSRLLERYEELVSNSPDPIIVLDPHSRIKEFNKACEEIWDWKAVEVLGTGVQKYYESDEHAKKIGEDLKSGPHQRLRNYPAVIKHRDGTPIPISLSASLLHDKNGLFEGSIGVFKDLRPMQLLEDKVRAAETLAALGRLARIVGHEIKNQMQIVLGHVKPKLLDQCREQNDLHLVKMYSEIRMAALTSIETVKSTLLAANLRPPVQKTTTAEDFFRKIHERMLQGAQAENVAFNLTFPNEEYEISADVEQMQLVLLNLYHNSMDSIEKKRQDYPSFTGGQIDVVTEVVDHHIHLLWQDDGIGIANEDLPQVFEAFFTKNKPLGTGLGLFLSRNVVESHGGELTVSSQLGSGACFRIALPISQSTANSKENS